jgi:hypothetical protein
LYRDGDDLFCRTSGEFEIDGQRCRDRGRISQNSRIEGDGFRFNLEPIR